MKRKFRIVVVALLVMAIVDNLSFLNDFVKFLCFAGIIYRAYVLWKRADRAVPVLPLKSAPKPAWATQPALIKPAPKPAWATRPVANQTIIGPASTSTQVFGVILIVSLVFLLCAYEIVSAGAFNFFVWGDHILGDGGYPVSMWMLAGALLGAGVGAVVIWRKYRINFHWCALVIAPLIAVFVVLQSISSPLFPIVPRPLAATADTARVKPTDTVIALPQPQKRVHKTSRLSDTTRRASAAEAECAEQLAEINVNVRADSVNIYYRTASYQNGPWSTWKSKFVAQQGQFALSDDGPVKANSLQYYYEVRTVLTRSAQNPFTRSLCDGPLTIDTY